jgi:hypothetical protein
MTVARRLGTTLVSDTPNRFVTPGIATGRFPSASSPAAATDSALIIATGTLLGSTPVRRGPSVSVGPGQSARTSTFAPRSSYQRPSASCRSQPLVAA